MSGTPDVQVGTRIPEREVVVDLPVVVRYAGASGDFNPLHYDPSVAARVSPTGELIAHGMLSMGLASALVTEWAGGPERVRSVSASFKRPCPVGATVVVAGEVVDVDHDARTATVALSVTTSEGERLLDRRASRAVVELP